jgi:predicted AlkP superfamily phosphohydrolase/phosphomutase
MIDTSSMTQKLQDIIASEQANFESVIKEFLDLVDTYIAKSSSQSYEK